MQQHHSNPKHSQRDVGFSPEGDSTSVMRSVVLAPVSRCDRED